MLAQGPIIHLTMIVFLKETETDMATGPKASPPNYHITIHFDDVCLVVLHFLRHSHGPLLSSLLSIHYFRKILVMSAEMD